MERKEPGFDAKNIDDISMAPDIKSSAHQPETTTISRTLATPRRRYLGQFLDFVVTGLVFAICLHVTNQLQLTQEASSISAILAGIYFLFSDALPKGQSLGKKALGIHVIDMDTGRYCNTWQSFLRNALTPVIGTIDAIFILTKKRQRIGDMLAGTIVVKPLREKY